MNNWDIRNHEARNIARILEQLNREEEKGTSIDLSDIAEGEIVEKTTRFSVEGGAVRIQEITHKNLLGCGHIGTVGDINALCDNCGRQVCSKCISTCVVCGMKFCPYCSKPNDQGQIFCSRCNTSHKRRKTARKAGSLLKQFFTKEA